MTKQKKFKKRVRAQMEETGERYTEAKTKLESKSDERIRSDYEYGAKKDEFVPSRHEGPDPRIVKELVFPKRTTQVVEEGPVVIDPKDEIFYTGGSTGEDYMLSTEEQGTLGSIWEYGPDVSEVFGVAKIYQPQKVSTHDALVSHLKKAKRDVMDTAQEIHRLRGLLVKNGIDPDGLS